MKTIAPLALILFVAACSAEVEVKQNGFVLDGALIAIDEIRSGGPPKDGIPAIDKPKFIAPDKATFMKDDDEVISVTEGGETRAYPIRILNWHEIVNDTIGKRAVAVTYCPLCGTGMVFDRKVDGKLLTFGVSGLLYRSDVLMYDRETESLWSQLMTKSVAGKNAGAELPWLSSAQMTWASWRKKFPKGTVLSTETGHRRDYAKLAYASYHASPENMMPVPFTRQELKKKEWVLGVRVGDHAKAYPIAALAAAGSVEDTVGKSKITVSIDPESRLATAVNNGTGEALPCVYVYWFAWQAFYPETEIWRAKP